MSEVVEFRIRETVVVGEDIQSAASEYASKINSAFEAARTGMHKLDPDILSMPGMSGKMYRIFINTLVGSMRDPRYIEIGSWAGSTLCSAVYGNEVRALAIDNWSQFGGPKEAFLTNVARFSTPKAYVKFIESDFRSVSYGAIGHFNVYMFDGPHEKIDQFDGLNLVLPALDRTFILIVDDWNWPFVREGTLEAIASCGLIQSHSVEIRTTLDNSHAEVHGERGDWHNGYCVAVLTKPAGS